MKVGYGPWFVALLFNENEKYPTRHRGSKRKTDIILHTYAHRIAGIRNAQNENDNWVMMQLIGPFSKFCEANAFQSLWSKKVRNKTVKLQRGLDLLEKYGTELNLKMWIQTQSREEIELQQQELKQKTTTKRFLDEEKMDIQTIQEMQKKRKLK